MFIQSGFLLCSGLLSLHHAVLFEVAVNGLAYSLAWAAGHADDRDNDQEDDAFHIL
jgi:hypothetical protein